MSTTLTPWPWMRMRMTCLIRPCGGLAWRTCSMATIPSQTRMIPCNDSGLHLTAVADPNPRSLPALDMNLMCHLIEIFCTRENTQLKALLPTAQIQQQLSQGTMSRGLILAVCASSMRFSVHKVAKGHHARGFAQSLAREARKCIHGCSAITWQQLDSIMAICVLVDYEASRAHGRQAWIDIG